MNPAPSLLRHARWTVPVHLALPIVGWGLAAIDAELAAWGFAGIHVLFLVFFIATLRLWWSRVEQLLVLVAINHVASFLSLWALTSAL